MSNLLHSFVSHNSRTLGSRFGLQGSGGVHGGWGGWDFVRVLESHQVSWEEEMGEDTLEADKAIEYDKNCLQKSSECFTEMFDQ